jgi:hypothetical protein
MRRFPGDVKALLAKRFRPEQVKIVEENWDMFLAEVSDGKSTPQELIESALTVLILVEVDGEI